MTPWFAAVQYTSASAASSVDTLTILLCFITTGRSADVRQTDEDNQQYRQRGAY